MRWQEFSLHYYTETSNGAKQQNIQWVPQDVFEAVKQPRSRMHGTLSPCTLYAFMACMVLTQSGSVTFILLPSLKDLNHFFVSPAIQNLITSTV
jgi:hypothetical protein